MLEMCFTEGITEAGCDEAGRGCLAGPVVAAAVILPPGYMNEMINDSKKLSAGMRLRVRDQIRKDAVDFSIGFADNSEIDAVNILNATFLAMHRALNGLKNLPEMIIVDGNRFMAFKEIPHRCIVKGDGKYMSIAAASVLAKTYRDELMEKLAREYPFYGWEKNAGYPTKKHRQAIVLHGLTPYHRKSFRLINKQTRLF